MMTSCIETFVFDELRHQNSEVRFQKSRDLDQKSETKSPMPDSRWLNSEVRCADENHVSEHEIVSGTTSGHLGAKVGKDDESGIVDTVCETVGESHDSENHDANASDKKKTGKQKHNSTKHSIRGSKR